MEGVTVGGIAMQIIEYSDEHRALFAACLEDWSDDVREAGDRRARWVERSLARGLRAKLAVDEHGTVGGMIQYLPIERSTVQGTGLYFMPCIWVHGHRQGRGNFRSVCASQSPWKGIIMELGTFSVSLAVKDLGASRSFYEKLGFSVFGGDASQNWLIMKNGDCVIGLFQGMFERNMLTFNPGWDGSARELASFTDVRELQRQLRAGGVPLAQEANEETTGPASFVIVDPDGNPILVDQHV